MNPITYPRGKGFVCVDMKGKRLFTSSDGQVVKGYRIKKSMPSWVATLTDGYMTSQSFLEMLSSSQLVNRVVLTLFIVDVILITSLFNLITTS